MPHRLHVVAGVLLRDGRVLAARRGPGTGARAGLWEFPGGKVEPGETPEQALVRELREELSVEVTVDERLAESLHDYDDLSLRLVAYLAHITKGEPQAGEHDALRWLKPDELPSLAWAPADVPFLPVIEALLT
jgi:8-oxo-dGTP diphosphatase